jgi:hypothetical protein
MNPGVDCGVQQLTKAECYLQPQEGAGFSFSFFIRFKDQRRNLYDDEVQMARKGLFSSISETAFVRKKGTRNIKHTSAVQKQFSLEKKSIYGAYAMYECMYVWKTLYYMKTCTALTDTDTLTNRARHTDFPCKRRI